MKKLSFILLFASCVSLHAQSLQNTFYDGDWAVRVKQLDDFVDRFNNELNYINGGVVVKNKLSEESRKNVILSLFNSSKSFDLEMKERFASLVLDNDYYIKLGQTDMNCILTAKSVYKNENLVVDFSLQIERLSDGSMKWVIYDAKPSKHPWKKIEFNPNKFINPSNHNLRFSSLGKFINEGNDIKGIFSDEFVVDEFSILVHEIIQGNLIIGGVKNLKYNFNILDQYNISIDYIDSSGKNSGWLISELTPFQNQ
jgi:hypothetical protein